MSDKEPDYDIVDFCGWVTDYDDSIGGEGEIICGAVMIGDDSSAECRRGHKWVSCKCDGPTCKGWKVDRHR